MAADTIHREEYSLKKCVCFELVSPCGSVKVRSSREAKQNSPRDSLSSLSTDRFGSQSCKS